MKALIKICKRSGVWMTIIVLPIIFYLWLAFTEDIGFLIFILFHIVGFVLYAESISKDAKFYEELCEIIKKQKGGE